MKLHRHVTVNVHITLTQPAMSMSDALDTAISFYTFTATSSSDTSFQIGCKITDQLKEERHR